MEFDPPSPHPRFTEADDAYLWRHLHNAILRTSAANVDTSLDSEGWVKLCSPPLDFSFDEALLMCQTSSGEWIAWVPDVGIILLHSHEFYA
jgi:hypothetical protein